jgi:hypothetical protein
MSGALINPARISAPFAPPEGIDKKIEDARYSMEVAKRRGNWKSYRDFKKCYERLLREKRRMEPKGRRFDGLSEAAKAVVEGQMGKPIDAAIKEIDDGDFYLQMKDGWDGLDFRDHDANTEALKYLGWLKEQGKATVERS